MNDKIYRVILFIAAFIVPVVCGGVVYALVTDAYDAFEHFGFFKFLTSSEWSYTEGAEQYGALPFITGTLMTTLLALIFCIPFSLPVARLIIILPTIFIAAVIKKRTRPIAMSDESRRPSASPNWLAMIDAIELPVEVIESGILLVLPISIVTVIVSPNARPIANTYDENIPEPATGNTTLRITSARVAPRL